MIGLIYKRAIGVLAKKPFKLWGLSLLSMVLIGFGTALFGIIPGVALGIEWLITVGMTMIYLHGYRGEDVNTRQLFDAFKDGATIKRTLIGMGWMYLWIFLWGLIPVVGFVFAIIRAYEYRLTPYILVTEPDVDPLDAIKISKERTMGYKGQMFLADLLIVLIVIGVNIALGLLGLIPYVGVLFTIIQVIFDIAAILFVGLFKGLVQAAFYEEITNPTILPSGKPSLHCPNCGELVEETATFCPKCGQRLKA